MYLLSRFKINLEIEIAAHKIAFSKHASCDDFIFNISGKVAFDRVRCKIGLKCQDYSQSMH